MSFEWLNQNVPAFAVLSAEAKQALMEFSFLWSFFEYEVLGTNGNVPTIQDASNRWYEAGLLTANPFAEHIAYFRDRYYAGGQPTFRFLHLHLEKSGNPPVVVSVLSGGSDHPRDVCAALLIIVFRYRNNFLHGEKWDYGLQEQEGNFARANSILQTAISLQRTPPKPKQ